MAIGKKKKSSNALDEKLVIDGDPVTITMAWINPDKDDNLVGIGSINVSDTIWVNVRLMYSDKNDSYFLSFPSVKKNKSDDYSNQAGPMSKKAASYLSDVVETLVEKLKSRDLI